MSICHWLGCLIICFVSNGQLLSQAYIELINEAKSSDKKIAEQISDLYDIVSLIDTSDHIDTVGLVYYFIATRYQWNAQIPESKQALDKSIYYFNQAKYTGYRQAYNYLNRAKSNKLLGFPKEAIQDAQSIMTLPLQGRSLDVIGDSQRIIASIYRDKGDDESAIRHLEYFLTTSLADSLDAYSKATILLDISLSYVKYSDSLSLDKSFQAISESTALIPLFYYPDEQFNQELVNEMQTAFIYQRKAELEKAIHHYINITHKIDFKNASIDHRRYYITASANLVALHNELASDQKVKRIISDFDDLNVSDIPIELAFAYSLLFENIADFQYKRKQIQASNINLNKAFAIYRSNTDLIAEGLQPNTKKHRLAKLLHTSIQSDYQIYNQTGEKKYLHASLNRMHTLDSIIDYINQDLLFEASLLNWREEAKEFYNTAIEIAYELNDHDSFWKFCEKAKGLALLDGMSNDKYFFNQESIISTTRDLKFLQLNEVGLHDKIKLLTDEQIKSDLNNKLAQNKMRQKDLLQSRNIILKKQIPVVANLKSVQSKIVDATIIQYYLSSEDVYALVLNSDKQELYSLTSVNNLKDLIREYRELLQVDIEDPNNFIALKSRLQELYSVLISPLNNLQEQLIIIPDADLFMLPFESILTPEEEYLIEKYSIQYLLSATLNENTKNIHKVNHTLIYSPIYGDETFSNLAEASKEAKAIAAITKGDLMSSDHKQELLKAITETDIFHFTGHSQMNENTMNDSYLAISDSVKISESEIYNYPNKLKLVVLSACDTGLGKILKGEGISNLTRSFIYTGAQAVVQSLWKINDSSSEHIMTSFYAELKAGSTKSNALQTAKINYLQAVDDFERHPYYWSGLVLVGSDASLDFKHSLFSPIFFLLVVLFVCVLFLFLKKLAGH